MRSQFAVLVAGATLLFAASCQQSATVNINNSNDPNRNAPARNIAPGNSGTMNRNSTGPEPMNANGPMNHSNMSMGENGDGEDPMNMKSSPNAADQPFDLQFIDSMTQHHQGAIVMAKMALLKSQNQDLRKFAERVIADQEKEIEQMETFRDDWYAGEPAAFNLEMPGVGDTMKMMTGERMDKMEAAGGLEFDRQFLEMMAAHHAGAVTMAKLGSEKAEHPELKTLAQGILQKQEKEIKQMQMWKEQWARRS